MKKKVLKHTIETEVISILSDFFYKKDPECMDEMEEIIEKKAKHLSKEFVKLLSDKDSELDLK